MKAAKKREQRAEEQAAAPALTRRKRQPTVDLILEVCIGLMLVAFVFVLYSSLHETAVQAGDRAPNFSIKADNGRIITPHDFGGKLLVLNFWATWCQPCVEEVPSLSQLQNVLGPKGVVVLGVSVDEDAQAYKEFLDRFHVSYLTARTPNQEINREYGTVQFPETYLIDSNGKVVEKVISATNWASEQMLQHVQSLL